MTCNTSNNPPMKPTLALIVCCLARVTLPARGEGIKVESQPGFPYEPIGWGKRKVGAVCVIRKTSVPIA